MNRRQYLDAPANTAWCGMAVLPRVFQAIAFGDKVGTATP